MNGKIKRATKPYICEDCGKAIKTNTDYFDVSWKNENGLWCHKRYCLECKGLKNTNTDIYHRVLDKLEKEGAFIAGRGGEKYWVFGFSYSTDGKKYVHCSNWDKTKPFYETLEDFAAFYYDQNGNGF